MEDPKVLVGFDGKDDAAVYQLNDDVAIINTLDFFTPMLDDPYTFGQIAAANALSDVYAMGGEPTIALNIVCFPCQLPPDVLAEVLKGGADKVKESGAVVTGGHSVEDAEPKYGLSVTGIVHPQKIWRNEGARGGDVLILTKPIGSGILSTAFRGGLLEKDKTAKLIKTMSELNKYAADVVKESGVSVHACTDITGFGLLGHLYEMAADLVSIELYAEEVALLNGTLEMANLGMIPSGAYKNKEYILPYIDGRENVLLNILCDPQTSGGLVFAIPEQNADEILERMREKQIDASKIGKIIDKKEKSIYIV